MSLVGDLLLGLMGRLEAAGVTGVTIGQTGVAAPDRVVALTAYLLEDDRSSAVARVGVSIRLRVPAAVGNVPLLDLQQDVFDALAYLENVDIGGVKVSMAQWWSSNPFTPDDKGRPSAADTYHFTCVRQSRVQTLAAQ